MLHNLIRGNANQRREKRSSKLAHRNHLQEYLEDETYSHFDCKLCEKLGYIFGRLQVTKKMRQQCINSTTTRVNNFYFETKVLP